MKNVFMIIGLIVLIIIESILLILGYQYATDFLTVTQPAVNVTFACGAIYFIVIVAFFTLFDWGYFTLVDAISEFIQKRKENKIVTLRDPETECPLGGSVSRERCDYCGFCVGEFGGSIKCKCRTK